MAERSVWEVGEEKERWWAAVEVIHISAPLSQLRLRYKHRGRSHDVLIGRNK